MIIWIDAQMSPALARWLAERFAVEARHVKDLDLFEVSDPDIFEVPGRGPSVRGQPDVSACRRASFCPIVYNALEEYKRLVGYRR